MQKNSRNSIFIRVAMLSLVASSLLMTVVSLLPIRWDIKSLRMANIQTEAAIHPGSDILLITANNETEYGHMAKYALDIASFPNGKSAWMILKKGHFATPWQPDYLIDDAGKVHAASNDGKYVLQQEFSGELKKIVTNGAIIISDARTRDLLPVEFAEAHKSQIQLLKKNEYSFVERPRLRASPDQVVSVFMLAFIVFTIGAALVIFGGQSIWISVGLAFPCTIVLHVYFVFLLGAVTSDSQFLAVILEFLLAAGCLIFILPKHAVTLQLPWPPKKAIAAIAFLCFVYFCFAILRLDFDGDLFTHWLPSARMHHLVGNHDIEKLLARYGAAHQATYPPGFPIFISTIMWVSGVPRSGVPLFGDPMNLMVFIYRVALVALQLSFLSVFAGVFKEIAHKKNSMSWLLVPLAVCFLLPTFNGQPMAGEIFLVPIAGLSILMFVAGSVSSKQGYFTLGVAFSVFLLFIKNDALLIVPLLIVPWYLVNRFDGAITIKWIILDVCVAFFGVAVIVAMRQQMNLHAIDTNFMFNKIDPALIVANLSALAVLVHAAIKELLKTNFWIPLFILLPLAGVLDWFRWRRWVSLLIPVGIMIYASGIALIYVFSRSDPVSHLESSYVRILLVAVLSSFIYSIQIFFRAREKHKLKPDLMRGM